MDELIRYWESTLRLDLQGFADPKSQIEVAVEGRSINAKWVQRGREHKGTFKLTPDGDFRWVPGDEATLKPYSAFLTSPGMADFKQLAAAMQRNFVREPNYVATTVVNPGKDTTLDSDAFLLTSVTEALEEGAGLTKLFFVKGDAGAGKTTLLRELVAAQADRFMRGETGFLFLMINAQGRALSSLRDALAGELQDLRAAFVRDAVPALARRGVLVPIIDGFDELLGAAGYGDAFGSLQQFLGELDGHGVMIVSARSSFYDVEFLGKDPRVEDGRASYEVIPVTLKPWSFDSIERYLIKVRGNKEKVAADRAVIDRLEEHDRQILTKPFFASRFPEYVDAQPDQAVRTSLLEFLMESYLRRETEKIVDKDRRPLLSVDGYRRLFEETAEAMWQGENRRLKATELRVLAELIASEFNLSSDAAKQFVTKITSSAGFKTADRGTEQEFTFEHEVYFDYFLTSSLRRQLDRKEFTSSIFSRGVLSDDVVRGLIGGSKELAMQWIHAIKNMAGQSILEENTRRNVGQVLAAAFATAGEVQDLSVGPASFVNVSFGRCTLKNVTFTRCNFLGTRVESTSFKDCRAIDCQVQHIVVSSDTRLGIEGLNPGTNLLSIVRIDHGEIYIPTEIHKLALDLGAPLPPLPTPRAAYTENGRKALELLKKVARKYERANVLCEQDDKLIRLFQDPSWPALRRLLVEHAIVREEHRQTSGSRKTFLRLLVFLPALMQHEAQVELPAGSLGNFWRALRDL